MFSEFEIDIGREGEHEWKNWSFGNVHNEETNPTEVMSKPLVTGGRRTRR